MYLLDTNVVTALRQRSSRKIDKRLLNWAISIHQGDTYLSAITLFELEVGVLRVERRDSQQGALLRRWLEEQVIARYADRTLPIDGTIARRCAALHIPDPRPEFDALIAATAITHGLTLVTRNVKDFDTTGVTLLNPWDAQAT